MSLFPKGPSVEEFRMPLLEHIRELRTRLLVSIAALVIGMGITLAVAEPLFNILAEPLQTALGDGGGKLARLHLFEGIVTWLRVAMLGGLVLASPVVLYQVWLFVAPGLYDGEKKIVLPLAFTSTVLFLAGGWFGYAVIFKYGFPYFLSVFSDQSQATLSIGSYLSTVTRLLLSFGICFQLPVVVFFLSRMGLLHWRDLFRGFRYAILAIFALSAFITPPDPLTQVLMAAPLTVLYIVSIGVAAVFSTKEL